MFSVFIEFLSNLFSFSFFIDFISVIVLLGCVLLISFIFKKDGRFYD